MANTSKSTRQNKPAKPRPDFPLFPHNSGKWAKTIRGRTFYFGRWDDPQGALAEYNEVADDLHAGRMPSRRGEGLTVRELCNAFMRSKRLKMDAGNLSPRTFVGYDTICKLLIDTLGGSAAVPLLRPADFERLYARLSRKFGPTSIGSQITQCRSVFKYAYDSDLIDRPVKFGPIFKAPTAKDVRKHRAKSKHENGSKTFSAAEIRQMLEKAKPQLKAMILLGINCGFGNTDCASLPRAALDLDHGWLDYPRPKTGTDRKCPLWLETAQALKLAIDQRPKPSDPRNRDLVFVTSFGLPWVRYEAHEVRRYGKTKIKAKQDDAIAKAMSDLLRELGIKRPRINFYALRHTFETVAGGCRDQVAVDSIMGHIDSSMAATYRHGIEDERLRAVVEHVHAWLFGE